MAILGPHLLQHSRRWVMVLGTIAILSAFSWATALAAGVELAWGDPPVLLPIEPQMHGATFIVPLHIVDGFGGTVTVRGDLYEASLGDVTLLAVPGELTVDVNGTRVELPLPVQHDGTDVWLPLRTVADHVLQARMTYQGGRLTLQPWHPLALSAKQPLLPDGQGQLATMSGGKSLASPSTGAERSSSGTPGSDPGDGEESLVAEVAGPGSAVPLPDRSGADQAKHPHVTLVPGDTGVSAPVVPVHTAGISWDVILSANELAMMSFAQLGRSQPTRLGLGTGQGRPLAVPALQTAIKATTLRAQRADWVDVVHGRGTDGREFVHITSSVAFTAQTFLLTDPARLVVDLAGLDTGHATEPLIVNSNNVRQLRLNQNQPDVVRLVVDLNDTIGYTVTTASDGKGVRIDLHHALRRITADVGSHFGTIALDVPAAVPYEVRHLTNPDRIVIDLFNTTLIQNGVLPPATGGSVSRWEWQQHDPNTVRLVLHMDKPWDIAQDPLAERMTFHVGHQVRSIHYAQVPGVGLVLHADGAELPDPRVMYLAQPDRLVIDLPGTVLATPLQDTAVTSRYAFRLRTGQHPDMVRLVVDLHGSVRYEVIRLPDTEGIFVVLLPPSLQGKSVFLDPGHGGSDPGTIGRTLGILEKDVVLDISRRLRTLLEEAGATVGMTRTGDTYPTLERRPQLAAQAKADVFLSVHANASASNPLASGVETYIYNRPNHVDNPRFAAAIQRQLVSATGLPNRGVKQANYAVLRTSFIPSALVEVGFLSRADEERLLADDGFRQRIAEGLFNGLVAYFSEGASRAANTSPAEMQRLQAAVRGAKAAGAFVAIPKQAVNGAEGGIVQVQHW